MAGHARAGAPLAAAAMTALVLYASLYPFDGWRWPPGRSLADLLALPWPIYRLPFDLWVNVLGYLPLGLLMSLALQRAGHSAWLTFAAALSAAAGLSYAAEVAQHFLPGRHPSLIDWALNTTGAGVGAMLAAWAHHRGWPQRAGAWLSRWLDGDSATAAALLALWPLALVFPAPAALGLGQIGPRLRPWLADGLADVPWAADWHAALLPPAVPSPPLGVPAEALVTALGLLSPCLVAYSVMAPGWRRTGVALGAVALATGVLTLSTALSFGPQNATAWLAPSTLPGLALGLLAALLLAPLPRRLASALGLVVLTAAVVWVAQAPTDPYFASSLQRWEQGRFIHFHGLTQWLGWLWPFAAGLWLFMRLGRRGPAPTIRR